MKNIRYIVLAALMLFGFTACEDFLDVNRDRNQPIEVTIDQALPPLIFFAHLISYDHAQYSIYLSQALTTANTNPRTSFAWSGGWDFQQVNRHPMWRRHFFDIGANNRMMMDRAYAEGARNFYLIGQTIRLLSTMLTTDAFGDMPHFDAFVMNRSASATPRYESQEDIYRWLFQEVEDLLDRFNDRAWTHASSNPPIGYRIDRMYGGDLAKWAALAKSLRARLWLRVLPNGIRDEDGNPMVITHRGQSVTLLNTPENARRVANYADIALNDPNWQEPRMNFPGGAGLYNALWSPSAPTWDGWQSHANRLGVSLPTTFFAHALLGTYRTQALIRGFALDPRAVRMMTPRNAPDNVGGGEQPGIHMRHRPSNAGVDGHPMTIFPDMLAGGMGASNPFTHNQGYTAIMLREELLFIRAEGEYWAGDIDAAFTTTREAVIYNMERWGVPKSGAIPELLLDRFFAVRLPGPAQFTIATLMQQKHVAMYLQPEQWTDMRRYNFSSPSNGIMYRTPSSPNGVFVYYVRGIHPTGTGGAFEPQHFTATYALNRPRNLWTGVWGTPDNFGIPYAELSPNAWVNRLNYDPETEPRFNSGELRRIGAMIGTEVVPDWPRNRLIWQFNTSGHAISPPIEWR